MIKKDLSKRLRELRLTYTITVQDLNKRSKYIVDPTVYIGIICYDRNGNKIFTPTII